MRRGLHGGGGGVVDRSPNEETPDSPDIMPDEASDRQVALLKLKTLEILSIKMSKENTNFNGYPTLELEKDLQATI